ncbi:putative cytoplasmic protein [Isoalcanivorax pacificus W11-5]|uniref:Putative cytoplasmic protein n=1 Tax=Isoalcanivorax pacificus W11-5 TaxID=391936 RepID=A0A0B4XPR6_9GAMM|nr:YaeQ family protein [Isoalcanivorax pacificus]AJD48750.1 putative cytoplasmic protein [Isoalcanivorax pacificus W11-5]
MALSATIYHASLDIADSDRNFYGHERLTLALHPSETAERMVARLLAWCLFNDQLDPPLTFGSGISTPNEPDLWRRDLLDNVQHWIDVGEPDADRVRKACLRSKRVTVLPYGRAWAQWWKRHEKDISRMERADVIALPWQEVGTLATALPRTFTWQVNTSDGALYIVDHRGEMTTLHPDVIKPFAG